jgi:phosphoribosylanthranilate isomerase
MKVGKMIPKVKICGLTATNEAKMLNDNRVEYGGFVLFYPKSKRNVTLDKAQEIANQLDNKIKKVAVTVSPTLEQVKLIQEAKFDFIQIHGAISEEVMKQINIPIFKAFHMGDKIFDGIFPQQDKIIGVVFDGKIPGKGKVFDWTLVQGFNRDKRLLMLAGGLNIENIVEGICYIEPDIVDVSTGVENPNGKGKCAKKVREFVEKVREI